MVDALMCSMNKHFHEKAGRRQEVQIITYTSFDQRF